MLPVYPYLLNSFELISLSNLVAGDFVTMVKVGMDMKWTEKVVITQPYVLDFGFVLLPCAIGDTIRVYPMSTVNPGLVGLIPGSMYYASDTVPGGITTVSPVNTLVIQQLGIAINTTDLDTQFNYLFPGTGGGGGGLPCTGWDVLIDGGNFLNPCTYTLIDGGNFI